MILLATSLVGTLISQEAPRDGLSAFLKMVPVGLINHGVRIPAFEQGRPTSLVTAETLVRLDDERLEARKMIVEIYSEEPGKDLRVEMPSAVHHVTDQILRSGVRSKVSREDFEMEGDSLVFDAAATVGSMKGRVRTLIFDDSAITGKSEAPAATKK